MHKPCLWHLVPSVFYILQTVKNIDCIMDDILSATLRLSIMIDRHLIKTKKVLKPHMFPTK